MKFKNDPKFYKKGLNILPISKPLIVDSVVFRFIGTTKTVVPFYENLIVKKERETIY